MLEIRVQWSDAGGSHHSNDPLVCQPDITLQLLMDAVELLQTAGINTHDSKVHGANMGPIWGRQDPGGPHVGPMNFVIWDCNNNDGNCGSLIHLPNICPWGMLCFASCGNVFCILEILYFMTYSAVEMCLMLSSAEKLRMIKSDRKIVSFHMISICHLHHLEIKLISKWFILDQYNDIYQNPAIPHIQTR